MRTFRDSRSFQDKTFGRGDILGYVGSSGHSTGPHLHYEVRIHDTPVNPSKYLHTATRQLASTPSTPTPHAAITGGGAD